MNAHRLLILPLALAMSLAQADSFTSSASSAASQSIGSLSDSVSGSSKSSAGDGKTAAAGAYQVTAVARLDAGRVQLQLAPSAGQLAGAALWVAERPYGLAFAAKEGATPFFLAVDDRLRRDFESLKL
jgi:hypothetical protein